MKFLRLEYWDSFASSYVVERAELLSLSGIVEEGIILLREGLANGFVLRIECHPDGKRGEKSK